jgi:hypothetical protein
MTAAALRHMATAINMLLTNTPWRVADAPPVVTRKRDGDGKTWIVLAFRVDETVAPPIDMMHLRRKT